MNSADRTAPNSGDEHIVHMWTPLHLRLKKGYNYRNAGFVRTLLFVVIKTIAFAILYPLNFLLLGVRWHGLNHLAGVRGAGAVTVCNHVHMLDCTMVGLCFPLRRQYFLTLKSNLEIPFLRHIVRALGGMPIAETVSGQREMAVAIQDVLSKGQILHVYPERVLYPFYDQGLRPFHRGAFTIASRQGVPILPMVVTFHPPRGLERLVRRKPCPHLTVLPPIYPDDSQPPRADADRMREQCRQAMEAEIKRRKAAAF